MKHTLTLLIVLLLAPLRTLSADDAPIPASRAEHPNIVYIIADDHAWTDFGFMGNERVHTPNLDRLAAQSARFTNGYVPTSVCRPSLVSLLTGLYPHQHGVHFNHGPPGNAGYNRMTSADVYVKTRQREFELIRGQKTLPGILQARAGYRCLQTGKFWEGHWRNGGFTEGMTIFKAPPRSQTFGGIRKLASGEIVAHGNGDVGLQIGRVTMQPIYDFIDDCTASETPWFVWYAPYLPHQPHDSPKRFYDLARSRPGVKSHELPYFASIAQFDETVGQLIQYVGKQGQLKNTVFIFVSDNGWRPDLVPERNRPEEFAHTARSKRAPFDDGLRTPILIRWDGVIAPATWESPVSSIDLMPTLLAIADIAENDRPRLPGVDLLPVCRGQLKPDDNRPIFGEVYPGDATSLNDPSADIAYRWIRQANLKLIEPHKQADGSGPWGGHLQSTALFDVKADPFEKHDLSSLAEHKQDVARLRTQLDRWWKPNELEIIDLETRVIAREEGRKELSVFQHLVRTESWTEKWPDDSRGFEEREITAEIWTAAMQVSLDETGSLHIPARDKPYYLDGPLVLKSGQRLTADAKAEIRLKPGSNTCMVRNANLVGFKDGPVTGETNPDTDIHIEGGIWTTLATAKNELNGNARGHSSRQNWAFGTHGVILFQNARRISVENVTVRKSKPFAIHLGNVHDFEVDGLTLEDHYRDGVHVNGPASQGVIRDIRGVSHDDPVALNAWEWKNYAPSYGPIRDVLVENVTGATSGTSSIRLLPGVKRFDDGTELDCPLENMTLRHITDIREFKIYDQPNLEMGRDNDFSIGVGSIRNLRFEDLVFNRPGKIELHANTDGLLIQNVLINHPITDDWHLLAIGPKSQTYQGGRSNDPARWTEIFSPDLDCTVRNVAVSGVRTRDSQNDLPIDRTVKVIKLQPNPDYPKTTPKGGTGKGIWIR